jgi:hypothetical protein
MKRKFSHTVLLVIKRIKWELREAGKAAGMVMRH